MLSRISFFVDAKSEFRVSQDDDNPYVELSSGGRGHEITFFAKFTPDPTEEREILAPFYAAAFHNHDWSDGVLAPLTLSERTEREWELEERLDDFTEEDLRQGFAAAKKYRRWADNNEERRKEERRKKDLYTDTRRRETRRAADCVDSDQRADDLSPL